MFSVLSGGKNAGKIATTSKTSSDLRLAPFLTSEVDPLDMGPLDLSPLEIDTCPSCQKSKR